MGRVTRTGGGGGSFWQGELSRLPGRSQLVLRHSEMILTENQKRKILSENLKTLLKRFQA